MSKSVILAALLLAIGATVAACKPADSSSSTTETKSTTTSSAPAAPAPATSEAAKQ